MLVASPSLRLIDADLAERGLNPNTRQLYLFFWRAKTQPKKLPLGLIFAEKTLAQEIHVSVRTIQRSLRTLVEQGLLCITPRIRSNGGSTSNRYTLTWQPVAAAEPTVSRAPITSSVPAGEPRSEAEAPDITPDMVFVWPALSGGTPTPCRGGEDPQPQGAQGRESDLDRPIVNPETFSKSDQPVPDGPVWTFDSEDSVQLFLVAMLKTRGIPARRVQRWIRQYGLEHVAQVTVWILSAPQGVIHAPGGWMDRALQEGWDAPVWVRQARDRRLRETRAKVAVRRRDAQDQAEGKKMAEQREQDDRLWARIRPQLSQLRELYAHAAELARAELGSLFPHLFRGGSEMERHYVLRVAREKPDLLTIAS